MNDVSAAKPKKEVIKNEAKVNIDIKDQLVGNVSSKTLSISKEKIKTTSTPSLTDIAVQKADVRKKFKASEVDKVESKELKKAVKAETKEKVEDEALKKMEVKKVEDEALKKMEVKKAEASTINNKKSIKAMTKEKISAK